MTLVLLFLATLFLAYANGANDNFKGVATLYGANTVGYRTALRLATFATLTGAMSSVFLAEELVTAFSGKGLVPDAIAATPIFLLAVAIGAGATVILATRFGFPVSTTHGLIGALAGAGYMAAGPALNLQALGSGFFLPLVVSPLLALLITVPLHRGLHALAGRLGITKESCVCIGEARYVPVAAFHVSIALQPAIGGLSVTTGSVGQCLEKYSGRLLGVSAQPLLDAAHVCSAAAVSFARGLNDTPKIVALLLVIHALDLKWGMPAVALAMAAGGWLNARRVAHTMSLRIARMNDGPAFAANFVTACLVIAASRMGLPVSTTHVSVGAIAGAGVVNRSVDARVLTQILASWLLTLPLAAAIAAAAFPLIHALL